MSAPLQWRIMILSATGEVVKISVNESHFSDPSPARDLRRR